MLETKLWIGQDEQGLVAAAEYLQQGELVAFPTETVYGLGANAMEGEAAEKIYKAKGRPSDNPLIVHIYCREQLDQLTTEISETAKKLMDVFWPGPLTIIFPKGDNVPVTITGGLDTVAVRMPNHPVALKLLQLTNLPIAAPSANTSGKPSPTLAKHVWDDLQGKLAGIVDGGATQVGLESTVIDITGDQVTILRPGSITKSQIEECLGCIVRSDTAVQEDKEIPKAPGMKYTHYAPDAPLVICGGDIGEKQRKLKDALKQAESKEAGLMLSRETLADLGEVPESVRIRELGSREQLEEIAAALFEGLRWFDEQGVQIIYTESFPEEEIGAALMNRLYKAAGGQVI